MDRRQTAIGSLIALLGGFVISKLTGALDLSPAVAAAGFCVLIVGLLLLQGGRHPTESPHGSR